MGDVDAEIEEAQRSRGKGLAVADASDEFYGSSGMDGMADSIDAGPEEEDDGDDRPQKRQSFTAPRHLLDVPAQQDEQDPMLARSKSDRIADREDEYHARRQGRVLSPSRADAFALGDKTPDVSQRSYKDVMAEQRNAREREELKKKIKEQAEQDAESGEPKKRRRWDQPSGQLTAAEEAAKKAKTRWDDVATPAPSGSKWDATPTPGRDPAAGKRAKKKVVGTAYRRSKFTGFAPGFLPMTEPWTQTQFSLELPGISSNALTQGTCQL